MPRGIYVRTTEHNKNLSKSLKGIKKNSLIGNKHGVGFKHTEEWKKRMSILRKENPVRYWLGKKMTEEHKNKISESHRGSKCYIWKGGISKIDSTCRSLSKYKQWRSCCFERDKWTCQTCGARGVYVTVHHIKSFAKIIRENNIKNSEDALKCEEMWDMNNGVTLCEECHKLTDNYKGRGNNKLKNKNT